MVHRCSVKTHCLPSCGLYLATFKDVNQDVPQVAQLK